MVGKYLLKLYLIIIFCKKTFCFYTAKDTTVAKNQAAVIGADDFLPLFVYSIVKSEFLAADIEAQYIEGKLNFTIFCLIFDLSN